MRISVLVCSALLAFSSAPALAAFVDPSLIPDGDYMVSVEKIPDAKHIVVRMDNGVESELPAAKSMSFDPKYGSGKAKIFVYKGTVITFSKA